VNPQLILGMWMVMDETHACPLCRQHGWRTWIVHPFSFVQDLSPRYYEESLGGGRKFKNVVSGDGGECFREQSPPQSELCL
jgi:hypothetical protein